MKKMQVLHFSMKKASNMPTLKCMHVVFFFAKHTLIWVLPHTMFLHVHAVGPLAQSINAPTRQRI